jgi:hypothetical protein
MGTQAKLPKFFDEQITVNCPEYWASIGALVSTILDWEDV